MLCVKSRKHKAGSLVNGVAWETGCHSDTWYHWAGRTCGKDSTLQQGPPCKWTFREREACLTICCSNPNVCHGALLRQSAVIREMNEQMDDFTYPIAQGQDLLFDPICLKLFTLACRDSVQCSGFRSTWMPSWEAAFMSESSWFYQLSLARLHLSRLKCFSLFLSHILASLCSPASLFSLGPWINGVILLWLLPNSVMGRGHWREHSRCTAVSVLSKGHENLPFFIPTPQSTSQQHPARTQRLGERNVPFSF